MSGYDGRGRKFPLVLVRGTDVAFQLTVTSGGNPLDMSTATITPSIFTNAGVLVDSFTSAVSGAGNNVVTLSLTDGETTALTASTYRWSLVVTRGGDKRPWLAGTVRAADSTEGAVATSGNYSITVDDDVNIDIDVQVIGSGSGGSTDAADINIVDAAGYYTVTNVEAALAEVKLIADTAAGGGVTLEQVQDDLGNTSLVAGTGITKTYSDVSNTITLAVTSNTYQPLDSDLTTIAAANNGTVLAATTASFLIADESKLDGIEAGADVTDTTNVTAAGALMDSEVDADIKTLSLPANTTISTFGASLIDDAAASNARTTLELGTIATQAANNVAITGGSVTGITDITVADGGTGASTAQGAVANLRTAPATVTGTTDTLAAGDDDTVILYTAAGAVTVTLANIATGFECVLVSLGAGGLSVAAGGMSFANSFTPKLTVAQGEALYVKQTAASTWIVLGGTAA